MRFREETPLIRYHMKTLSSSGREKFIFLCNKTWVHQYHSEPWMDYLNVEVFLLENSSNANSWYWGGNGYLKPEHRGYGLVITDPVLATHFMLSGLCHES